MYRPLFAALFFCTLLGMNTVSAADAVKSYTIDPSHTRVLYFISHLGFSKMPGQFNDVTGTIQFDPNNAENSSVDALINARSLSMGNEALDKKLQGPDYFNVIKYPLIRFTSTKTEKTGSGTGTVTGDLTLLGVTKPVTLDVRFNHKGYNKYAKAQAIGFSAKGKINRSDFGMKTLLPDVGDEIELRIEAEASATPEETPAQAQSETTETNAMAVPDAPVSSNTTDVAPVSAP